jgi:hypothetical protein
MDSHELLKKYIAHVVDCQGVDFIASGRTTSTVSFTDDERRELDRLSEAVEVDIVLREEPAQERPTLVNQASPNLIALFRLMAAYVRDAGPVQIDFRDGDRAITTAQDAFLRHLADRILVI